MAEYIEREALIEKISSISITIMGVRSGRTLFNEALKSYREAVLKNIKEAPTADVVEVVRCRDCEFFSPKTNFCRCHDTPIYEDDFCNYGERKEE